MREALRGFLLTSDLNWMLELLLLTAAWLILRFGTDKRPRWTRVLLEFLLLGSAMTAGFLLSISLFFPDHSVVLFWGVLQGGITWLYFRRFSTYQTKTAQLLWLALYTSSLSIMPIAGEASILVGTVAPTSTCSRA